MSYVGRISDLGYDFLVVLAGVVNILKSSQTRVLSASLRGLEIIANLAAVGVCDFTMNIEVILQLLNNQHSLTPAEISLPIADDLSSS